MNHDLDGRHIVVTGATGDLGRAVVAQLTAAGAHLTVPVRDSSTLPEALKHHRVRVVDGVDLREERDVDRLYSAVGDPLWASLQLAGGFSMAPLADTTAADVEHMWRLNALSCFLCCRAAAGRMGDGGGRLVNVAARPALVPSGGAVAYTMSKAAVVGLTHTLSEELASREIWVNAVVPSLIDTPRNRADMPDADHDRWPSTAAVADVLVFLASPRNRVARGALVPVYGRT